jgi:hypothetical protein
MGHSGEFVYALGAMVDWERDLLHLVNILYIYLCIYVYRHKRTRKLKTGNYKHLINT